MLEAATKLQNSMRSQFIDFCCFQREGIRSKNVVFLSSCLHLEKKSYDFSKNFMACHAHTLAIGERVRGMNGKKGGIRSW